MKHKILLLFLFVFSPELASAQTPTLVQHVSCPNAGPIGSGVGGAQSATPDYVCPLPEPTQAGNVLLLGMFSDDTNSPTWTVSDDKSNTWTMPSSAMDSSGNIFRVYYASNIAAGTRMIKIHASAQTKGYLALSVSEFYNVAVASPLDTSGCTAGSGSTSITAGSITPTVSGDLLWQWAANAAAAEVSPFTVGSQSSITWQFLGTDTHDGDATQAGVYNSTSPINPTFTGTSEQWDSCVMALKAAAAGNAPTAPFHIVHMLHAQELSSDNSTYNGQFPSSGNLLVLSFISGSNEVTSVSSNPPNSWTATGAPLAVGQVTSQVYYAASASTSNSLTFSVPQTGTMTGSTFMMYDITGAASSPFDKDSGGQSNDQSSIVSSLTTCSGCLAPSAPNELVIGNFGQAWCTATGVSSPSGSLFDAATYTGNSANGPSSVDQNNGWFHYYDPNTNPITVTWTESCGSTPESAWAGRVAAFKSGGAVSQQPAPPTQLNAVVH
jgi:hypothetical protein